MNDTCKWTHYKNKSIWSTECGNVQGIKIRPKQKRCFCGKKIERIEIDDLSPRDKEFRNILNAK